MRPAAVLLALCLALAACAAETAQVDENMATAEQDEDVRPRAAEQPPEIAAMKPTPTAAGASQTAATTGAPPPFYGRIWRLPDDVREKMKGSSWHRGCPVPLRDLRYLKLSYWRFDGEVRRGAMVVHFDVARDVVEAYRRIYNRGFKIRRMRLVDVYGADDDRSMAANNTSAFNCRYVKGTTKWSQHAYGRAIDINPIQNPYVSGSFVDPPEGERYLDRSNVRRGMIVEGGKVTDAFDKIGWGWGGRWTSAKDYQHVSESGR